MFAVLKIGNSNKRDRIFFISYWYKLFRHLVCRSFFLFVGAIFPEFVFVYDFHGAIIAGVVNVIWSGCGAQVHFATVPNVIHSTGILADFYARRIANDIQMPRIAFHINFIVVANDSQMNFIVIDGNPFAVSNVFAFFHFHN